MMKDISDEELKMLEQNKIENRNKAESISEEKMIEMVQKINRGEKVFPITNNEQKIIEPEYAPKMSVPNFQDQVVKSNYWKIDGLPSKSKFYSEGTEILGRPLKVLEVKKISSMTDNNGDFILNDIIRKTITGIDVNELYVADKLYIIFWLRANTYRESGYVVPFVCSKCGKKSEYHFEINNLEVQQISDDFNPRKELKIGNSNITYDYLKIKDELYLSKFKELNSNTIGEIDDEILAMSQMVKTINGIQKTLLEKYYWMIELEPGDFAYLKNYIEKKGMGIKPFVMVECQKCGGTGPVGVTFQEYFFVPEYKFE